MRSPYHFGCLRNVIRNSMADLRPIAYKNLNLICINLCNFSERQARPSATCKNWHLAHGKQQIFLACSVQTIMYRYILVYPQKMNTRPYILHTNKYFRTLHKRQKVQFTTLNFDNQYTSTCGLLYTRTYMYIACAKFYRYTSTLDA